MWAATALALLAPPARAEEWKYDLAVYMLGAGIDGTVGIGRLDADVDVGFSDILDNLEFGAMGALRASKDRWAVTTDLIYVGLGASTDRVEVDVDQLILQVDLAYGVSETFEVLFGVRYLDLDNKIAFRGPLGARADAGDSWVDPVVGVRLLKPLGEKWSLFGRLDFAGFGVGSDFSLQAGLNLDYRISPRTSFAFGWRHLDVDFEDGDGRDRFKYDVVTSGPQAGLVFHF